MGQFSYAAVVLVVAILGYFIWGKGITNNPVPFESIAILPIDNLTGDPENDFLADGVLETLISEFGRINDLKVIARSSIMQYKRASKPAPVIGQELGVERLLESTLLTSVDSLRLTTRLVDASTGDVLSSHSQSGPRNDLYGFQKNVSLALLNEVANVQLARATTKNRPPREIAAEAEKLYLKGNFYFSKSQTPGGSGADLVKAEEFFLAAAREDSIYAAAAAGYALVMAIRTIYHEQEVDRAVLQWANQALKHEPENASAHLSLALYSELEAWDWQKANYHFERALESEPGNLIALYEYGLMHSRIGRNDVLAEVADRMTRIDPISERTLSVQWTSFLLNHEYDRLLNAANEMLELEPNSAIAYHFQGKSFQGMKLYQEAEEAYARSVELNNGNYIGPSVGCMYAHSGQPEKALEVIESFMPQEEEWICHRCLSAIYGCLGDKENAIYWLERLLNEEPRLGFFVAEHIRLLKDEPRYQKLLEAVNLDQYRDQLIESAHY